MTEYKIEKGIPLYDSHKGSGGLTSALRAMEVGDSVLVPVRTDVTFAKFRTYVAGTCSSVKRYTGFSFATRKDEGGVRVWRLS